MNGLVGSHCVDPLPLKVAAIIPARLASSRLPRKLLLADTGKPLIQHTYEAVAAAPGIDLVAVATGDREIQQAVEGFGGQVLLTDPDCPTGTERVRRATQQLPADFGFIINVQGDEPEVQPEAVHAVVASLRRDSAGIVTLASPICDRGEFERPSVVKVVCDISGCALYFSRAPIPHNAGVVLNLAHQPYGLRHIGIYGFRRATLEQLRPCGRTVLDRLEKLEQLGWLESGQRILVIVVALSHPGIDVAADYADFVQRQRRRTGTDPGLTTRPCGMAGVAATSPS